MFAYDGKHDKPDRVGWMGGMWTGVRWRGSREAIANQMGGPCLDKDRDNLEAAFLRADPC